MRHKHALVAACNVPNIAENELELSVVVDGRRNVGVVRLELACSHFAVHVTANVKGLEKLGVDVVGRAKTCDHVGVAASIVAPRDFGRLD